MEQSPVTIGTMSEWSEQLVSRFAAQLRERRTKLDLSAQQLADRTEEMGHPVSRTAIADFELGRRKDRLMLGDALVLAEALRMPLAAMLYPQLPDGEVEVYPGLSIDSMSAVLALTGDILPTFEDDLVDGGEGREIGSQRIEDYFTGWELLKASQKLTTLRESLAETEEMLNEAMDKGDMSQATGYQQLLSGLRERIARAEQEVRNLGGVVHDG